MGNVARSVLEAAVADAGPTIRVVTNLTIKPQVGRALSVAVEDWADFLRLEPGPTGADRRFPIFARSINVFFWLTDFVVAISSDFNEQSCAYRTTRRHELQAQIYEPIRIFHSYRDVVVRGLNATVAPTEAAPWRVASEAEAETRSTVLRTRSPTSSVRFALH
jgi:hypothetical protein